MTVRSLPPALVKKAEKEINEKATRAEEDVTAIREWLNKQPHLESVRPTDQWIIAFLRGSKFSLERCKEKMEMFYTCKSLLPEFFESTDPFGPRIQEILKLGAFLPLKNCSSEVAPRVCLMRVGVFDPSKYNLSDLIKVALMVTQILMLEDDNFTVSGEEIIIDGKDVGMNVLSQWTPTLAKKIMSCFEKAFPVRLKCSHILNTPPGFETAFAIFKSFLGPKLKKRVKVHNKNYNGLNETVPKSILPKEYGGSDGGLKELTDHWKAKVESYRDWFLREEQVHSDEAKRSDGAAQNSAAMFGIEGSFRKLEVD